LTVPTDLGRHDRSVIRTEAFVAATKQMLEISVSIKVKDTLHLKDAIYQLLKM